MGKHPDKKALKGFISGEMPSEEARRIEAHLSLCSECRDQADAISDQLALQLLDSWLRPGYDEAFERATDRTAECLAQFSAESSSAEDLLAELLQEPVSSRRCRIANDESFYSLKFCQLLLARSRDSWWQDPADGLEMADLAVEVALHLESGRYGSSLVEDSRALAWSCLGNTLRITSDLWRAEQALQQAWYHHMLAGQDPYTEASLLVTTSSLREVQGRYDEALQLSDKAISIYREAEDSQLEGSTLLLKGLILGYQGRFGESLLATREGLDRIDPTEDPVLLLAGTHNLIWYTSYNGDPEKARELIGRHRQLYEGVGEINHTRLHWLEGQIARELGEFAEAESLLSGVREFFVDRSIPIDSFLASLDLAGLYVLSRQPRKVKEVLGEVIPLGEALGLSKKVFLAKMLFERASRS